MNASKKLPRKFRLKGIWHEQSGQSLVELALLAPILLLLVIGIVEMGRYGYMAIVLGNAARAGASYGAQGLAYSVDNAGITTAATNDFNDSGETSGLSVTSSVSCGCDSGGTVSPDTAAACSPSSNPTAGTCAAGHWVVTVHVTTKATFNSLFSYPGIPKSLQISSTAEMRVKQE